MKPAPFDYFRPKTVAEASVALGRKGITTAAIAGGQSLLPMLNLRVAFIDLLIDISRLDDLKAVTKTPDSIWMGALTTHAAIEDGKVPDIFSGLMRQVARQISYRAIRNHGTVGGSVALADPAADWPCCLTALDASIRIVGRNGVRVLAVTDFVRGPYESALTTGDIIMGFDIPAPQSPLRWGFAKVARKSGAFANSISIACAQGRDGPVSVVLGAAGPRPIRLATVASEVRAGRDPDALRDVVLAELDRQLLDADAYQRRMHTATILRAVQDMRTQ
jgi:carbon-monoxide dehydrogenase medium subunit